MKKRRKLTRRGSRRLFKATAAKVHKRNNVMPNRGGLRM